MPYKPKETIEEICEIEIAASIEKANLSKGISRDLAEQHVSWFLEMMRPLLIEHMMHGFKHGQEFERIGK